MRVRLLTIIAALAALALVPSTAAAAPKKTFLKFSAGAYSVVEGNTTFNLTVQRTGATSGTTTATVAVVPAGTTAVSPGNYDFTSPATVTFNAGETAKTVPVTIKDDTTFSGANKTVQFALSGSGGQVQIRNSPATLTIIDNDGPGTIDFSAVNYNVVEGAGVASITLTRNSATNLSESVDYATNARPAGNGNASAGVDYMTTSGTATFAPNQMTATFQVPILDDSLSEGSELLNLSLSNPKNLTTSGTPNIGPNAATPATLTIIDDDSTFAFSSKLYSVAENATSGTATVTVNRSGVTNLPASVYYATGGGSATAGSDYTATSGTLDFAAGETQKTFDIPVTNDGTPESTETVNLTLAQSSAPGALVFDTSALNILDNDSPVATVQLANVAYDVNENAGSVAVTVTLSHAVDGDVTVPVSTGDVTNAQNPATGDADYTAQTSTPVTFVGKNNDPNGVGETSKTISIPILQDTEVEGDEVFQVNLGTPTGANTDIPQSAVVTIHDDDVAGDFEFSSLRYDAAESGGQATISVRRVGGSSGPASVDYYTTDGSAAAPGDYTVTNGTLSFADGETQKTFQVPVSWDGRAEGDETVNLALMNPSIGSDLAGNAASVLHIADDGASGPARFTASSPTVNEADGTITLTVTRAGGSAGGPVSVDYATSDDSATAGSDYTAQSGTLTFGPNELTKQIRIPITDDTAPENGETFTVTLSNPAGGIALGTPTSATVTIVDDDAQAAPADPSTGGGTTPQSSPANPNPAGSQTARADRTAPKLTLSARHVQKALKARLIALGARCSERCTIKVTARIGKGRRAVTLGRASARVAGGKIARLKVKLSKRAAAKLLEAMRRGRVKVTLSVIATDAAHNRRGALRAVTVKR